ncbi:MAG: transcriptional regulator [Deltaproteobacteria bacterium SG8_13]|nr:MAG: transcriptional regulator [Deltaproteobacteria bacterium SG8_13]
MPWAILVIDDDEKLNRLLKRFLGDFDYTVYTATDAEQGLKKLRSVSPDLIILDVMLPAMTGFDLCKRIRQSSAVPIIMLTARGDLMDKVVGLELGADDYLPKPFEPRELVARIQAVLRRTRHTGTDRRRRFGRLVIDFHRQQAWLDKDRIGLTTNEFAALDLLVRHAGKVMDRDEILQTLRGIDSDPFNRAVDVTISRLRQKLGDDPKNPEFIKTVWGAGYVFIAEESADAPSQG